MLIRTSFPYETTHADFWIPLQDGTRLYARAWRPLTGEPVPALLEYLPDRLTDSTAPRDRQRHPWYAGHGYASVRVDARGHGNSDGLPADPCAATEPSDGVEVVRWLAAQPWCDGRVGLFGISRGGFLSLRIAALAPEPVKAVVTVCAPDGRQDNDVHDLGGSVLTGGLPARAGTLLAFVARPPDPTYVGAVWRDVWARRLAAVDPFVHAWPAHRTRDGQGRRADIDEDLGSVRAAVLAVGGWHDPHRDTVFRLVERLPSDRVRGLIGPWSHQYPDHGLSPGPAIGFLQETLRWWDHWLKGRDTGVMAEPPLRAYVGDSHPPATTYDVLPGRWVGEPSWPSPNVTPVPYALRGAPVPVRSPMHTGLDAGRFVPRGNDADLPTDQREEDARSACFEFEAAEETWVLGRPRVRLRLTCPVARGQVVARLCDVAPDGASTLVTRGALNLSARHGGDRPVPWTPGATEDVVFELSGIGHAFRPGHRIRLAVSSAYWPWLWPQPGSEAGFTLDPAGSSLELPVRTRDSGASITFAEPEQSEPLGVSCPATFDEPRPERLVVRDVAKGEWRLEADPRHDGTRVYPDGLEVTEDALETHTIEDSGPLTARVRSDWSIRLHRPETGWDARVETHSGITCTATDFVTSDEIICRDGDHVVFHRTWEKRIPRTMG
ncbi:CocE/NonD family hydrolase [Streptomyces yaanensis]|uniref:CocE/NonD family hydrolase n=1 Tax=Streptomyces yaanensis TaxID=1142239 RepID=A0ABV7SJ06_9ACTN|nr:CocE/NonD family hydrolase [Streptomyces sp. CGMCC 4.7035]WNB97112.1 CocE/NonD family hydrolase [Streptomyces sp. CGMCC 4.7035]